MLKIFLNLLNHFNFSISYKKSLSFFNSSDANYNDSLFYLKAFLTILILFFNSSDANFNADPYFLTAFLTII